VQVKVQDAKNAALEEVDEGDELVIPATAAVVLALDAFLAIPGAAAASAARTAAMQEWVSAPFAHRGAAAGCVAWDFGGISCSDGDLAHVNGESGDWREVHCNPVGSLAAVANSAPSTPAIKSGYVAISPTQPLSAVVPMVVAANPMSRRRTGVSAVVVASAPKRAGPGDTLDIESDAEELLSGGDGCIAPTPALVASPAEAPS
jgi:hypothetical protein